MIPQIRWYLYSLFFQIKLSRSLQKDTLVLWWWAGSKKKTDAAAIATRTLSSKHIYPFWCREYKSMINHTPCWSGGYRRFVQKWHCGLVRVGMVIRLWFILFSILKKRKNLGKYIVSWKNIRKGAIPGFPGSTSLFLAGAYQSHSWIVQLHLTWNRSGSFQGMWVKSNLKSSACKWRERESNHRFNRACWFTDRRRDIKRRKEDIYIYIHGGKKRERYRRMDMRKV